ncbi:MAG TPA: sulfite exporter TauE/SafE family protein [Opitutales bacterium]|nr:sulfite exporter TauE/SafE family protein [Opitutales bacterium]
MFSPASIDSAAAAFFIGLATSPHCALMCGPLGCAVLTAGRPHAATLPAMAAYQGARLAAYTVVGALAGGVGTAVEKTFAWPVARALPWVLAALLLVLALRLERWLPKPLWLWRGHGRIMFYARRAPTAMLGAMLGAATPLLPCGPLYILFTVALFAGSAARGATLALAFGLGTLPLLWLAQIGLARWQLQIAPAHRRWAQSALALSAAILVAWRATAGGAGWLEAICH